jgi:1-acyl-sn-glycerol-3-phosphate acyltransferase
MIAKLRYFVTMFLTVVAFFPVIVIWLPLVAIFKWQFRFTAPVGFVFSIFFKLFGVKVKVTGKENLDPNRGFVIMSNHQSFLDIPLIIGWVRPASFLAKKELFDIPIFGSVIKWGRCISVNRGHPRKNKNIPHILRENLGLGSSYCVFPEGTRSEHGKYLQFKTGMFKYLLEAPVPVLPVTIRNSYIMMPKKGSKLFSGEIEIVIHPIVEPETYAETTASDFRDKVADTIKSAEWKES